MKNRSNTPLALALVCLAALAPSPASAESAQARRGPTLPKGWIRGSDQAEKPPAPGARVWGSFQSIHESSFSVRASMPGGRVELGALPVVAIEPTSIPEAAPSVLPSGSEGDVIVLKKRGNTRVSVQGFEAGFLSVGKANPAAIGRQSEGGLSNVCGRSSEGKAASGVRSLAYEAIRRVDQRGTIELVWARGFLDLATCRASILERHTARPRHIGGGVVYAFITRCSASTTCEGARDVLHVLTPQMSGRFDDRVVPFEHRRLELAPGKSAAFEGSSSFRGPGGGQSWGMPDWHGVVDRQCKQDSVWCFKSVRFEVSQGAGEPTSTVFVGGDVGM